MAKKQLFTLEYSVRCSPQILYEFLSSPAGLQEWFADKVDQRENTYLFTWNGNTDRALILEHLDNEFIRYRWDYQNKDEFFEFSIEQSPVTNETILRVTDFADKIDQKDQERLWNSQVSDLKHRIGS